MKSPSSESNGSSSPTGPRYWRSLDDLAETPGFQNWLEREFPEGASELDAPGRRNFLKIMAASFGVAGLTFSGCRRPEQTIMPYGRQPEEIIPGVPNYYSTSLPGSRGNVPLVVESHQARPTKVEGNPSYKQYGGGTCAHAQASVLDLYDPDRAAKSQSRRSRNNPNWNAMTKSARDDIVAECAKAISEASPKAKVAFLASSSSSPTRAALVKKLQGNANVIWAEHDAIDFSNPEQALGKVAQAKNDAYIRPVHHLAKAKRIFSLDSDFLGIEPDHLRCSRDFSAGRDVESEKDVAKMNRLYVVEANLTLTGSMADHRLRLETSRITSFARLLAAEVLSQAGIEAKGAAVLRKHEKSLGIEPKWLQEAAKDLVEHAKNSASVVLAGSHLPDEVHALTFAMNQALNAIGKTVEYVEVEQGSNASIEDLATELEAGNVQTLIFMEGNPAYTAPRDWPTLLKKVKGKVIRFGYSLDETSDLADIHLASTHYLESWSDGFSYAQDSLFPVQPLIQPLFDGISELDFLARVLGSRQDAHALVKATFARHSKGDFDKFLRDGKSSQSPTKFEQPIAYEDLLALSADQADPSTLSADNLDLVLVPSFHNWDGSYANNGWMQECPDPLTRLTWDNAILISPKLAKELESSSGVQILPNSTMLNKSGVIAPDTATFDLGMQSAPVAKIKVGDTVVEGPVHVQPGLATYSIVASLGFGRRKVGRVGEGTGFDAYPLLVSGERIVSGAELDLNKDLGRMKLANVQEHWSMEGRAIIREGTTEEYAKKPDFVSKMGMESHSPPIYGKDKHQSVKEKAQSTPRGASSYELPDHKPGKHGEILGDHQADEYGLHQWGMAIDLNRCTGCSSCVIACQSENNIPIVGKDQVLRGREMHWIRMDRYFSSEEREGAEIPEDVQVSFQGMSCSQCETAPCESVCPVNATVHDEEGLNAMAYNRCVGTRYCANNCPYKVRRFNFFDWNKRAIGEFYEGPLGDKNDPLPSLQKNPDVSVRMRGVMEKCTYCVQRIQEAKIQTKIKVQQAKQSATGQSGSDLKLDREELKVPDGTIKPACQQSCGSDAIVFGDISDPESKVSKLKASNRDYSVLGYLGTRPRTTYLAKLRNPNPSMPDKYSYSTPHAAGEHDRRAHSGTGSHGHGDDHGDHHEGHKGDSGGHHR
tara:strand:+ start:3009 stop:6494 length:3486 start_codon:yes stop_codon:yes gene_type:complete